MFTEQGREPLSRDITLREHGKHQEHLDPGDVRTLRQEHGNVVTVTPTDLQHVFTIRAHHFVGFIALPSQRVLEIRPKVRIDVLFAMLNKVHGLAEFLPEQQEYTAISELFEFIANTFVEMIEALIAQGILRDFVTVEDELRALRGKLMVTETIRSRPVVRDRHWCSFVEFTPDIPENQILKQTAEMLSRFPYTKFADLTGRLQRIVRTFGEVDSSADPFHLFEHLVYHRLNQAYQPALTLARMLLSHLSPSGKSGGYGYRAFLVDMNKLFEDYVTVVLREAGVGRNEVSIAAQETHALDMVGLLMPQPDITLYADDAPLLILDTKYKLDQPLDDIYQMIAYCHALDLEKALLIYPMSEVQWSRQHRIRPDGRYKVVTVPIDLSGDPDQLRRQTERFVEAVWKEADLRFPS